MVSELTEGWDRVMSDRGQNLLDKLMARQATVAVIGLGYVELVAVPGNSRAEARSLSLLEVECGA